MPFFASFRPCVLVCGVAVAASLPSHTAHAEALLLVEADTGKVLHAENATYPWYPASVTKLMTAYVTLRAIKDRRLGMDTLLTVSSSAMAQQPSKMGFKPGIQVTVDNALKMIMVKSANDMAVVLAEGVSGSIEKFAAEMTRTARGLGMTQTTFVNPNGLPADGQVTSARDLAMLARALIRDFPEHELYWRIPAIRFGRRVMANHNPLIDRYPGADGMKTGFICASGFNLVATATHGNKRLIAVVLGAPSSAVRTEKVVHLFEKGFNTNAFSWLIPSLGTVDSLKPVEAAPPDLHEEVCGKNRRRPAAETAEEETPPSSDPDPSSAYAALQGLRGKSAKAASLLGPLVPSMPPVVVFVGPAKKPGNPDTALVKAAATRKPKPANVKAAPAVAKPAKPKPGQTSAAPAPAPAPSATTAGATPPSSHLFNPAPTLTPNAEAAPAGSSGLKP